MNDWSLNLGFFYINEIFCFKCQIGSIALVSLTGVLVFMLFLAAMTVNAVVISLLMSMAAVGGFLAIFFSLLTAIYIGALSVAVFTISAVTISTIFTLMVVTGTFLLCFLSF